MSGPRLRNVPVIRIPLGDGREWLEALDPRRTGAVVTTAAARLHAACATFDTLENHARTAGLRPDPATQAEVAGLQEKGLLVSPAQVMERAAALPATALAGSATLDCVSFATRNRPDSLERAVESYARNTLSYGRRCRFQVADGSDERETRAGIRARLAGLSKKLNVPIAYAGAEEKTAFAAALAATGAAPRELIDFALFDTKRCGGSSLGTNRNVQMLESVGQCFLAADDDTLARGTVAPETRPGLHLYSDCPIELWPHRDRQDLRAGIAVEDLDLLGMHEQLLGKDLAGCVATAGPLAGVERAADLLLRRLSWGARVRMTGTGLAGDSGMKGPLYLLMRREGPGEAVVASEEAYRQAITSRELLRVANRVGIGDYRLAVAGGFGFDHRTLAPPWLPVKRNQDGVFSASFMPAAPDVVFGCLPYALLHEPPEARTFTGHVSDGAFDFRVADLVIFCLELPDFENGARERPRPDWLTRLGSRLVELGTLPPPDFERFLRRNVLARMAATSVHVERLLKNYWGAPEHWARDARTLVERTRTTVETGRISVAPTDLREGRSEAESVQLVAELVRDFGRLMVAWPALCEAAQDLRGRGLGPTRPV